MLYIDGSVHAWFTLAPEARPTLLTVPDDATNRVLYAQFWEAESTRAVMTALRAVFREFGLPMALYSDRTHWALHTPKATGPVDKQRLTQVGRALARLGVEPIPAYSEHNATFSRAPRDPEPAWVPIGDLDLDQVLCHEEARVVSRDNTVTLDRVDLQLAKQPGRRTCAGLDVVVRRHLDGRHSVWRGPQRLGVHDARGRPVDAAPALHDRQTRPHTHRLDRPPRPAAGPQGPQASL